MGIEALNCQCCGAPLKIADSTCECEYCGRINIIGGNAGKYINQLNKANRLRQQCEFDHAYNIYDIILSEIFSGLRLCANTESSTFRIPFRANFSQHFTELKTLAF